MFAGHYRGVDPRVKSNTIALVRDETVDAKAPTGLIKVAVQEKSRAVEFRATSVMFDAVLDTICAPTHPVVVVDGMNSALDQVVSFAASLSSPDVVLAVVRGDADVAAAFTEHVQAARGQMHQPPTTMIVPVVFADGAPFIWEVMVDIASTLVEECFATRGLGLTQSPYFGSFFVIDALTNGLYADPNVHHREPAQITVNQASELLHRYLVMEPGLAVASGYAAEHFIAEDAAILSPTRRAGAPDAVNTTSLASPLLFDVSRIGEFVAESNQKLAADPGFILPDVSSVQSLFARRGRKLRGLISSRHESPGRPGVRYLYSPEMVPTHVSDTDRYANWDSMVELILKPVTTRARFNLRHYPNGPNTNFLCGSAQCLDEKFGGQCGVFHNAEQREILNQLPTLANALGDLLTGQMEDGLEGRCVVDLGAGTGIISEALASAVGSNGRLIATEVSAGFVELMKKRFQRVPQVSLVHTQDDAVVGVPTSVADIVLCCDVYHHLERPFSTLRDVHRVLKPVSGLLVVIDFHRDVSRHTSHPDNPNWVLEHVRCDQETVIREIESCGFKLKCEVPQMEQGENYYLVFSVEQQ